MFKLRPYQERTMESTLKFINTRRKLKPMCIVNPTGAGKSIIVAKTAKECEGRTLILQPSKELLLQNLSKYRTVGGLAGTFAACLNKKEVAKTTFGLIGSVVGSPDTFKGLSTIIIDEAHLYPPNSDSMFRKFITAIDPKSNIKILGLTATPFRLKSYGFGESKLMMLHSTRPSFFKQYGEIVQIAELTAAGFWSPLEYKVVDFTFSGLEVNSTGGDYTDNSLSKAATHIESRIEWAVAQPYKRGIVFVSSVEQARRLAESTDSAAYVCGATPPKERDAIISSFAEGRIRTIFNVNVLSVGFDCPEIDCVILARPTMSGAVYYQQVGRGARIAVGKEKCTVIDLVGNTNRFGRVEDFVFRDDYRSYPQLYSNSTLITGVNLESVRVGMNDSHTETNAVQGVFFEDIEMPFGKYEGKKISTIPIEYIEWLLKLPKLSAKLKHALTLCRNSRQSASS